MVMSWSERARVHNLSTHISAVHFGWAVEAVLPPFHSGWTVDGVYIVIQWAQCTDHGDRVRALRRFGGVGRRVRVPRAGECLYGWDARVCVVEHGDYNWYFVLIGGRLKCWTIVGGRVIDFSAAAAAAVGDGFIKIVPISGNVIAIRERSVVVIGRFGIGGYDTDEVDIAGIMARNGIRHFAFDGETFYYKEHASWPDFVDFEIMDVVCRAGVNPSSAVVFIEHGPDEERITGAVILVSFDETWYVDTCKNTETHAIVIFDDVMDAVFTRSQIGFIKYNGSVCVWSCDYLDSSTILDSEHGGGAAAVQLVSTSDAFGVLLESGDVCMCHSDRIMRRVDGIQSVTKLWCTRGLICGMIEDESTCEVHAWPFDASGRRAVVKRVRTVVSSDECFAVLGISGTVHILGIIGDVTDVNRMAMWNGIVSADCVGSIVDHGGVPMSAAPYKDVRSIRRIYNLFTDCVDCGGGFVILCESGKMFMINCSEPESRNVRGRLCFTGRESSGGWACTGSRAAVVLSMRL